MAFSTPKTGFIASEGFANTDINKTNENIRVLAGGDNTLPLSTDAATAYALAKRDADGDIAFRDVVARDIAARDIAVSRDVVWPIDIEHDKGGASTNDGWEPLTRRIYIKRTGTITTKFTGISLSIIAKEARIYKNGIAAGTNRDTNATFTETFSAVPGDYFEVWGHGYTYFGAYGPAIISNFLVSSGSTVFI